MEHTCLFSDEIFNSATLRESVKRSGETVETNTERDETPDGEFYMRDQKRLPATVEETEEIEEIENSPGGIRRLPLHWLHSTPRDTATEM
ncbi:hypothetical protein G5I_13890 [Acromyrmex echinatior]|uniref:Uncharacterized protein n=1 Tax=Acromyrmex echinatior TaxID=103372 RepID=F4X681_ACREC|nr:hypothetical protein G5I_13890 [Acromyrmex echinatior]